MKRLISIILIISACVLGTASCAARDADEYAFLLTMQIGSPVMNVNGVEKEIDPGRETCPIIENDRTLVPVRAAVEEMGGTVEWDEEEQAVTLTKDGKIIRLVIGSNEAELDGEARILDAAPVVINDRTMLPIRFIAESFGYSVDWDENTQIITISLGYSEENSEEETEEGSENTVTVTIGDKAFTAVLYDNETARAFAEKLPLTMDMSELNGNEYYFYLGSAFPTDTYRPDGINKGDIKLYGNDCVVIFYESFTSSYSYTDIGYIENPAGLEDALKSAFGTVSIERGTE